MDETLRHRIDGALFLVALAVGIVAADLLLTFGWDGFLIGTVAGLLFANVVFSLTDRE